MIRSFANDLTLKHSKENKAESCTTTSSKRTESNLWSGISIFFRSGKMCLVQLLIISLCQHLTFRAEETIYKKEKSNEDNKYRKCKTNIYVPKDVL